MEDKKIELFLLKATFQNDNTGFIVEEKYKYLWKSIWRAHRDVLTGRRYLPNYCKCKNDDKINKLVVYLFDHLKDMKENDEEVYSEVLFYKIECCDEFKNIEFGAIQKLVNMTFKYLICVNHVFDNYISINEKRCDCPLDSIILNKLKMSNIKWTRLEKEEYKDIQKRITQELMIIKKENLGNIYFDFINW